MPRWHLVLLSIFTIFLSSNVQCSSIPQDFSESSSSNYTCFLPDCRYCDILDLENCTCTKVYLKCANGFKQSDDGCSCIPSNSSSIYCPDLVCPDDLQINEARCECTDKICQTFAPCPENHVLDLETCQCICGLDPQLCPLGFSFDEMKCKCHHPQCNQRKTCSPRTYYDEDFCSCMCVQGIICDENFIFDASTCDCILKNGSYSEPSCTPQDCYECFIFNTTTCECAPYNIECQAPYKLSKDGCRCIKDPSNPSPNPTCKPGKKFDEIRGVCVSEDCQWKSPCEINFNFDPDTCDCTCYDSNYCDVVLPCDPAFKNVTCPIDKYWDRSYCKCACYEKNCDKYSTFNYESCKCVDTLKPSSTICGPPQSCPKNSYWDNKYCACRCTEYLKCHKGYYFDSRSCQCTTNGGVDYSNNPDCTTGTCHNSSTSCHIPDCRPCDHLDQEKCECYRIVIDCPIGFKLSDDGCSCVDIPGFSSSSESSSTEPSKNCSLPNCRWCDHADWNNCICYIKDLNCPPPNILSNDGCTCFEASSSSVSSSSSCYIPDCRSCDFLDEENCICYKSAIKCAPGYITSEDGCNCIKISESSTSMYISSSENSDEPTEPSSTEISSSSSCYIPDCRWCDYMDYQSCVCHRVAVDCLIGWQLSTDGCSCEKPLNCSDMQCPPGTYLDEFNCLCIEFWCESPPECAPNFIFDNSMCQCVCDLQPSDCPAYYIHDPTNCICRHPPCDPPGECPGKTEWNSQTCRCQCPISIKCPSDFVFDHVACDCVSSESNFTSSSTSVYVSSSSPCPPCPKWCDVYAIGSCECYITYLDCYLNGLLESPDGCSCIDPGPSCRDASCSPGTYVDPVSCECIPLSCTSTSECPPNKVFDTETCDCICDLSQEKCPPYHTFDSANCICRHPPCDPPGPCPGHANWDHEICRCKCTIEDEIQCPEHYYFDYGACDCKLFHDSSSSPPSNGSCTMPDDCKWCDVWDDVSCHCYKVAVYCYLGYELSTDGCTCIKSTSTSENCPNVYCDNLLGLYINETTCECLSFGPNSETSPSDTEYWGYSNSSSSPCVIPSCRWCDMVSAGNCQCQHLIVDCFDRGTELSPDGCECIPSNRTHQDCPMTWCDVGYFIVPECSCICLKDGTERPKCSPSSSYTLFPTDTYEPSISPSSTDIYEPTQCSLDCARCDEPDYDKCVCINKFIDCPDGYEFDEHTCTCVESNSTSSNCPGIYCEKGTYIDEIRCECINDECKIAPPCSQNLLMDVQSCECFCNLSPWQCRFPNSFDQENCKCRHPPCLPVEPCTELQSWDPEECICKCNVIKQCASNFTFDSSACDCMCDPKLLNTTCPSGSVFDPEFCECVEEIDCYDSDDPLCACECPEIYECPENKVFDMGFCECVCSIYELPQCDEGYIFSDETCKCEKVK